MLAQGWLERTLPGQSNGYRRLVIRVYAEALPCILGPALGHFVKGLYYAASGRREEKLEQFLAGSVVWGECVRRFTRTRLLYFGDRDCPPAGHVILLNHVNELDFAFDSLVFKKPYLANEAIKQTLVAYWWMRGMGSQVFDHRHARTIPASVRGVLAGLEHRSYVVYPEGGNSYGEAIRPLRKGMLKLAFEHRIPVFVALKSGMASFQVRQRDNVLGYLGLGRVQPADFSNWAAFRDHLQALMASEKPRLDERVRAAAAAASAAPETGSLPPGVGVETVQDL